MREVLTASVHDVRYFAALLRGVNFSNARFFPRATVTITQGGFTITVEEARALLGTAYVVKDIFDEYAYNPEPSTSNSQDPSQTSDADSTETNAAFEIQLNTLIDCLNIFGSAGLPSSSFFGVQQKKWRRADSDREEDAPRGGGDGKRTGMRMKYRGTGHPLTLLLAEDANGPTTTCEIVTFEPEPFFDLPFDSAQTVLKIILKSSWLRDALSELDSSCEKLTITGNPPNTSRGRGGQPILRLQAAGTFGSTEMEYPNDREVLETVECVETVKFSYRHTQILRTLRALQSSTKTSLRINADGVLSLQFLMPRGGGMGGRADGFLEFRCMSLDEIDDF